MPGRALGLRQDHDPAPDRGPRAGPERPDRDRRRGGRPAGLRLRARGPPRRADVPGLRPVSASARAGQRRLRPARPRRSGAPAPRAGTARPGRPRRPCRQLPAHALGRRTAARGARPGARPEAPPDAARRAVLEPRCDVAHPRPRRCDRDPARRRHAGPDGHPRRRRGGPDRRSHPRHAGRPDPAARHAGRALRASGEPVRGRLLRPAEPLQGLGGRRRGQHAGRPGRGRRPRRRHAGRRPDPARGFAPAARRRRGVLSLPGTAKSRSRHQPRPRAGVTRRADA